MDPQQWEQIQSVFDIVADLPPGQQHETVKQICNDDLALAENVFDLLREDARDQPLLDAHLGHLAKAALHSDHLRSLVQQRIGPYRLLHVLGEGGMGVVYLAERTDIGGYVAIKLLRDAWLSPMRRQRFAAEQQMLARLNHPAIARIYDASSTADGTPWFVMEFADGRPLTEYLRVRKGTVREDLLLFLRVCDAVQYAHSHAVIHRDLKPSNILVTAAGEVKLLDFGIAKQLDGESDEPDATITGLRLLTPAYAAPEQRAGGSVGVFTDIYALGVLLFEILAGEVPHAAGRDSGESARPSSIVRRSISQNARYGLSRREWADLDVLCLTALQPDPARRYRSVDALSRDLTAYLDGRPLEARGETLLYTVGKFARRNRVVLTSITAGLVLFAVLAVVFTIRLAHARDAALAEAARTARIQRFTENLFDGGDASAGPAIDLKVAQVLERGRTEAESLRGDPRMQADMLAMLGGVYAKLGHLDQADSLLQAALDERRNVLGTGDRQYAESLVALGLLRKDQARMGDAEKLLWQALTSQRRLLPKNDPDIERSLWALGSVLSLHGNYAEAKKLLEEAVDRGTQTGQPTTQLAEDLTQLGDVHHYLAEYDSATEVNKRALAINEKLFGERHPAVADNLSNLGNAAENQGRYAEAEVYLRHAVTIMEAWYGPDHPKVAENLTTLAHLLVIRKRFDEAQVLLQRALTIQQNVFGQTHSKVALAFNELGVLAYSRDQDDEAERDFRSALAIWRSVYGDRHQFVGLSYANLAGVYMDRKDYPAAEQMCREALEVYRETLSEDHLNPVITHVKLGRILMKEHRFVEAEPETLTAYRYLSAHSGPKDNYLKGARKDLVEIETQLGKPAEAARFRAELEPTAHPAN